MADETLEFSFVAVGQDVVQKAFEDLKLKQFAAAEEAKKLSRELRGLAGSEGETAAKAEELQRAMIRAQQSASQFGRQASALVSTSRQQTQSVAQTTVALTSNAQKWGQVGTAMGQVGGVVGHLSPQLGAMGAIVGQVGGAVTGLTGAMGPVGIAIGAVTAAVGIASIAIDAFSDDLDENAEAAENTERSVRDLAQAYRDVNREQNIRAGLAARGDIEDSVNEQADAIARLRGEVEQSIGPYREYAENVGLSTDRILRNVAALQSFQSTGFAGTPEEARQILANLERINDLERERAEIQENLQRVGGTDATALGRDIAPGMPGFIASDEQIQERDERFERAREERSRSRGRSRSQRPREAPRDFFAEADAENELAMQERARELEEEVREASTRRLAEYKEKLREAHELETELANERKERAREEMEARLEMLEREKEKAREATEQVRDDAMGVLQPVVAGLTDAIRDVITGAKSADEAFQGLLASFLEMIAQEAALQAAKEFASAIASFASQDYGGGALHVAAGVAYTAVAVAAGAASVAVAPPAATPAEPEQSAQTGGGGEQTIVINWNSPVVTTTTHAELGQQISGLVSSGERRFGRRAAA